VLSAAPRSRRQHIRKHALRQVDNQNHNQKGARL
jgi:hypothetical protein